LSFASRPTLARIDLGAVASNYRTLGRLAGSRVLATVKADAYGHGAVTVARALEEAGADFFCVAIAEEAVALREAGLRSPILILNYSEARDVFLHRALGLTPTLHSIAQAREFSAATRTFRPPLAVHLKVDTGLTRIGIQIREVGGMAGILRESPGLAVEAVYSHYANAVGPSTEEAKRQEDLFREVLSALRQAGVAFDFTHLASSGALLVSAGRWCDAVRPGLTLFGVPPAADSPRVGLVPVLRWETRVMAVRDVGAGVAVGYGGKFVTARRSRLAVLPVGYHDGYRRAFSGRVPVLLPGGAAPTVGAISMDLTVCDVTDIGAREGDAAVLLGTTEKGSVTAFDMARAADTNPYEIFCGIGSRVPRVPA
jgi:alanine racemase